jgi:hypothetical protein
MFSSWNDAECPKGRHWLGIRFSFSLPYPSFVASIRIAIAELDIPSKYIGIAKNASLQCFHNFLYVTNIIHIWLI